MDDRAPGIGAVTRASYCYIHLVRRAGATAPATTSEPRDSTALVAPLALAPGGFSPVETGQWYPLPMRLMVELDREVDGRWIADVAELPGVMVYGSTREAALSAAQALVFRVLADRLEHGEALPEPLEVSFVIAA